MRLISKSERHNSKGCILTMFETILNYREILKTSVVKGAFLRHLIQYGTSENILKTRTLKSAI